MAVDGLHVLLAQLCTAADLPTDWELLTNAGYAAELVLWDPAGTPVGRLALNLAEPDDDGPTTTEHAPVLAGAPTPANAEAAPTVSRAKALVAELLSGAAFDPTPPSTTGCVTVQYLGYLVVHWAFGLAVALRLGPYVCVVQHNPFAPADPRYAPTAAFLDTIDGGTADAHRVRHPAADFQPWWNVMLPDEVVALRTDMRAWLAAMYECRAWCLLKVKDAVREDWDSSAWGVAFLRGELDPDAALASASSLVGDTGQGEG